MSEYTIETMCWHEAGPMISYVKDHVDLEKFNQNLRKCADIKDYLSENELKLSDLFVGHGYIRAMDNHQVEEFADPEEGTTFYETCGANASGATPITMLDWADHCV